jgi:Uma2 family endonuclease
MTIDGAVRIPQGFADLREFREWARSTDYPDRGDFCWLDGELWADLSMEDAYTHNKVKTEITNKLDSLAKESGLGDVYSDGMRLSHPGANLSCEPDAMYISFAAMASGAVREVAGAEAGVIEFEGSPDMVLEIVSESSEPKDTVRLLRQYFVAGVQEYWIIDARGEGLRFEIMRRGPKGFVKTRARGGLARSQVFGRSFRLMRGDNPLGRPTYTLAVS